eukprot:7275310-Prymnesium_polylepis.1
MCGSAHYTLCSESSAFSPVSNRQPSWTGPLWQGCLTAWCLAVPVAAKGPPAEPKASLIGDAELHALRCAQAAWNRAGRSDQRSLSMQRRAFALP